MKHAGRIEEHGLHIWAGFYENGFRLMRDCYDQLNATGLRSPDAPLGTLDKAFTGLNRFLLAEDIEKDGVKEIHPWFLEFEPNDDKPGTGGVLPTPFAYFQMAIETIVNFIEKILEELDKGTPHTLPPKFAGPMRAAKLDMKKASPLHHLRDYIKSLSDNAFDHTDSQTQTLGALTGHAQNWFDEEAFPEGVLSDEARRLKYLISLSMAFFKGTIDNGLFRDGFDAIDDWEISEWLLHYGASQ